MTGSPTSPVRRRPLVVSAMLVVVVLVAAASSYGHMLHVASLAGEPIWIARAWPISVDGLAVVALHCGRRGRPWLGLALFVSVASNVLARYPELVADIAPAVTAWPPIALFGCHVLLDSHNATSDAVPAPAVPVPPRDLVDDAPPAASLTTGAGQPGDDAATSRRRRAPAPATGRPAGGKENGTATAGGNRAERQAAAAVWRASVAAGKPLTGVELADRYGRSDRWGRDVISEARQNTGDQEVAAATAPSASTGPAPVADRPTPPARPEVAGSNGNGSRPVAGGAVDGRSGNGKGPAAATGVAR